MAQVRVLLFAAAADAAGAESLDLEIEAGSSAADVIDAVARRCRGDAEVLRRSAVAVNEQYARRSTPVRGGDVVAIIPPVSGG